jgi:hypothetical protein
VYLAGEAAPLLLLRLERPDLRQAEQVLVGVAEAAGQVVGAHLRLL